MQIGRCIFRPLGNDCIFGSLLGLTLKSRSDAQATDQDLILGETEFAQFALHCRKQISARAAVCPARSSRFDHWKFGDRCPLFGDPTRIHHALNHVFEPGGQSGLVVGTIGGVVVTRGAQDAGQHCALLKGQLIDIATEVLLRGRFDAIRATTEPDGV
ncbi:hypothetical protein GALL_454890 [mine drainage metagenome]|uniref:Uncharacterized protein n=1 Tax=mine drainage metagenome TaxID=410659 RepID=A0A1J5PPZ7_9ZZZZ